MYDQFALEGVDGFYSVGRTLIAVQSGTSPERVMEFTLDSALSHVISQRPIESATPALDPTHGVVVGKTFYYIANSGWNELGDNGRVKKGTSLTPARIMRAEL